MNSGSNAICSSLKSALVGKQLTGVVFIHDYLQLLFDISEPYDDSTLNVYSKNLVTNMSGRFDSGGDGYRDALCSLIGLTVASLDGSSAGEFLIELNTGDTLAISLHEQDRTGPEAAEFNNHDNLWVVFP